MPEGLWYMVVTTVIWLGCLAVSPQVLATQTAWVALDPGTKELTIRTGEPQTADFSADSSQIPVAWATFQDDIHESGWAYLQIETNEQVEDDIQAYAAGALEANLTRQLMEYQWTNMYGNYCENQEEYCRRLDEYMRKNTEYSKREQHRLRNTDSFWNVAHLQMKQLAGLSDEFDNNALDSSREVDGTTRAFYLNVLGDMEVLEQVLKREKDLHSFNQVVSCSAIVKVVGDTDDLYISHDTWFLYRAMLRIQKRYIFPWHSTALQKSPEDVIPGYTLTMSAYPGMLTSWDSYYLTSGGLAITETEILNNNEELWDLIKPDGGKHGWERAGIAARLARSGDEWARTMSRENSGTANTQMFIVDYKLFTPGSPLNDGTFYFYEQIPGFTKYADMSHVLQNTTYWPGYNAAYFDEMFTKTKQPEKVAKYGDYYSYENSPRAKIFRRDHVKIKDMDSLMKFMTYNDYEHDPLSRCNCSPPYSPTLAIAARYDLVDPSGQYELEDDMYKHGSGGIDVKATNHELFKSKEFVGLSGPTWADQPPFQWSTSGLLDSHVGHPDTWQFEPVLHKWAPARRATQGPVPGA